MSEAGAVNVLCDGVATWTQAKQTGEGGPPCPRAEGLLFLHGLESNPGSSLQTEEEAGLP